MAKTSIRTPPSPRAPSGETQALRLAAALLRPECYPHPVRALRMLETHISWVFLTGDYAYKVKKPVELGFLDFSSLELRKHYCEEELRLNRRLAPELYLEVVEIRGTPDAPRLGGAGPLLDYAVKMREFPQEALAARLIERGAFGAPEVDALAERIARFHAQAPAAPAGARYGSAPCVIEPALANFRQALPLAREARERDALLALERWTRREFALRRAAFEARQAQGRVRECHGDLHLGNIALIGGRPIPFDCIEFSEELRWIDVASEAAFLFMDLADRGHAGLAWRFLDRYLAASGDYGALEVLRFYLVYRALVRAKVHLLRSRQPDCPPATRLRLDRAFRQYLQLAERFSRPPAPALLITCGLSGSGKTTVTDCLIERIGAVRVRSDIERKRLFGLDALARSGSELGTGLYSAQASEATYGRLAQLAQSALGGGFTVVADAAFLARAQREPMRALASKNGVPFVILACEAPEAVLRERVAARTRRGDDASEASLAVLEHQIATREPLAPQEAARAITIETAQPLDRVAWRALLARLARTGVRAQQPAELPA
jgi:aminoglycoside phosphotransferase family enzyme/predicted kinase